MLMTFWDTICHISCPFSGVPCLTGWGHAQICQSASVQEEKDFYIAIVQRVKYVFCHVRGNLRHFTHDRTLKCDMARNCSDTSLTDCYECLLVHEILHIETKTSKVPNCNFNFKIFIILMSVWKKCQNCVAPALLERQSFEHSCSLLPFNPKLFWSVLINWSPDIMMRHSGDGWGGVSEVPHRCGTPGI